MSKQPESVTTLKKAEATIKSVMARVKNVPMDNGFDALNMLVKANEEMRQSMAITIKWRKTESDTLSVEYQHGSHRGVLSAKEYDDLAEMLGRALLDSLDEDEP